MTKQIIDGNKLIAEFMEGCFSDGVRQAPRHTPVFAVDANTIDKLKYHSSWDWLMPVVEKIEGLGFEFDICQHSALILNDVKNISEPITIEKLPAVNRFEANIKSDKKISATWQAVTDFIQWYNQNKPQ